MSEYNSSTGSAVFSHPLRSARLARHCAHAFDLRPGPAHRAALADALGLCALPKLRFVGALHPSGKRDWELRATLGATVVQECVVTLDPVRSRIDEQVLRRFLHHMPEPIGDEVEMPEDDSAEQLGDVIDVALVATEALALALPPFPRAPGAALGNDGTVAYAPSDAAPLKDSDLRPFADLAALRDRLRKP